MVLPELAQELLIRDVMISPPITIEASSSVKEALQTLLEEKIPAVMVSEESELVGYVDIFTLSEKAIEGYADEPVKAVMKRSFHIVKANKKVIDVMRIFSLKNTYLIAVSYKGRIMGYVTMREMIRILPEIIDSILATKKFEEKPIFKAKVPIMGYCDRCGAWSDKLIEIDGNYYCPDCVADIFGESL